MSLGGKSEKFLLKKKGGGYSLFFFIWPPNSMNIDIDSKNNNKTCLHKKIQINEKQPWNLSQTDIVDSTLFTNRKGYFVWAWGPSGVKW